MKTQDRTPLQRWTLFIDGLYVDSVALPFEADKQFAMETIIMNTKNVDRLPEAPKTIKVIGRPVQHYWMKKGFKEPVIDVQPEVKPIVPSLEQSLRDLSVKLYGHPYGFMPEREKLNISISIS